MREKGGEAGAPPANTNASQPSNHEPENGRVQPPYTMHGVLHFIQHEWSRYEMERTKWDIERAEMQARISFLQGERRGQENLKADLVRRIKMLEFCLKQERAKNYRLTHNGDEPPTFEENEEDSGPDPNAPLDVDAYPLEGANAVGWKQGRQLLKQYLEEIGYSETILDVRSFRMKNLLGLIPPGQWPSNGTRDDGGTDMLHPAMKTAAIGSGRKDGSESSSEHGGDIDGDLQEALDEFSFLKKEPLRDDWHVDPNVIDQLKRKYKSEKEAKRQSVGSHSSSREDSDIFETRGKKGGDDMVIPGGGVAAAKSARRAGEYLDINDALGLPVDEGAVDIKDIAASEQDDESTSPSWAVRAVLRSHLDVIRAMQFHPVEPVLFTAGEDGTTKLWNLDAKPVNSKEAEKAAKNGSNPSELEPVYTFRGHTGPVLCMDTSPTGDRLFTGGVDGVICCWAVPSTKCDPYDVYDPKVLRERLSGHSDAVWALAYHSSDNRLVSASADGTVKLWEPGNFAETAALRTLSPPSPNAVPTSIDFCSTEPLHLLTAYTGQQAMIVDIETGKTVVEFDFGEEANSGIKIMKILSHPTMGMTVMAGDDRKIRYFDNSTGAQLHSAVAHVEGISSLAIDSNGLYLLSGSHDGSLRLWNLEKRACLKEIPAHRKKLDAAVTTVAIHPSRPLIGSAGADSLAKVYTTESRHWSTQQ